MTPKKNLSILQEDARITNVHLASIIGISLPEMLERVKCLDENKINTSFILPTFKYKTKLQLD